jgi:hypothetical protein
MVFLGSTICLLVHMIMPDLAPDNLAKLWTDIKTAYDELGIDKTHRFGGLKMSMFSKVRKRSLIECEGTPKSI